MLTIYTYKFLHKDYLGSILAITDEDGNIKEQRHFDAWGNLTHYKVNGVTKNVNEFNNLSLIDRGYISHEHFTEVGIIHMNGRLYDPLLRRFLNADEFIQDPQNTQVYNKYAYVVNNPLLYADVSGEDFGISLIIAAAVAAFVSVGTDYYLNRPVDIGNLFQSVVMAVVSAGVSNGIGEIFKAGDTIAKALKGWTWVARAGAHAIAQGTLSYMQGGNFWSGALAGAFASVANDLLGDWLKNKPNNKFLNGKGFALLTGAVSGGVGSVLGGGNFWMGAGQGLIVTAFNFLAHKEDGPGPKKKANYKIPRQTVNFESSAITVPIGATAGEFEPILDIDYYTIKGTIKLEGNKLSVVTYANNSNPNMTIVYNGTVTLNGSFPYGTGGFKIEKPLNNYKAVNEFGYVGYNYIGRADFILPRGTMIFNVKVTVGYIGLINENTNTVVPFYPFGRASYNHSFFSGKAGGDVIQRPIINY